MFAISNYKNLIRTVAVTDFKVKYQGSFLGYMWSLVKPLLLFLVLYTVFTKVFKIGGSIPHYPVYLLLGIVVWNFFLETSVACLFSVVSKGDLIRKVYFPRVILVISSSLTVFLTFIANFFIVFLFMAFQKIVPSLSALFILPFLLIELYVLVLGVGLFLGALYVKFRDLGHIWEIILQALFYATPILYPVSLVPRSMAKIIMLSPVAQIIQDARFILITSQADTAFKVLGWPMVAVPYILPPIIFVISYNIFEKMAAKFAEEV